jgi:hypothetical protein
VGVRLEGWLTDPGMIDAEKRVDRFGHLATPERVSAKTAANVHGV